MHVVNLLTELNAMQQVCATRKESLITLTDNELFQV